MSAALTNCIAGNWPQHRARLLTHDDLPIRAELPRPDEVGIDRLGAGVAANFLRDTKRPAVVVDVGINALADGGMAGDVDPAVASVAGALSPVPGGVGPVTTALLLQHVVEAASRANG